MKDYIQADPLIVERGEGSYLIDVEGNRYIDGVSSLWVLIHGHGRKELTNAIKEQAEKLCHSTLLGLANPPSIILAKELVEIAPPGLSKVFYSDNGSTSVEIALKMAYQYWQQKGEKRRTRFLTFLNAYHGDTIGAVSVGGIDLFHQVYDPLLFTSYKSPSPYCYRCPLNLEPAGCSLACLEVLEKNVRKHKDELCALILEPAVQGAAGIIVQPDGFLKAVRRITRDNGVLMIADEVATGFGRTGDMFACLGEDVTPDFMCVAKGITGGYLPLAATLTTREIFTAFLGEFDQFRTFFHGHTYTGNPLASAVAVENLRLFRSEGLIEKVRQKADYLKQELARFCELPHVGEVRQKGLMIGIELVKERRTRMPFDPGEKIGQKVIAEARKRGVVIRPLGDVIVLMPPLSIEQDTLEELVAATRESIGAVLDR
jgi:adenosylmethionine-8-amino-7-oxononanoate aminotransferase